MAERYFKWVDPEPKECGTVCTFVKWTLLVEKYGKKEAQEILIINYATEISQREFELLTLVAFR